jgi:hypothetical protein
MNDNKEKIIFKIEYNEKKLNNIYMWSKLEK